MSNKVCLSSDAVVGFNVELSRRRNDLRTGAQSVQGHSSTSVHRSNRRTWAKSGTAGSFERDTRFPACQTGVHKKGEGCHFSSFKRAMTVLHEDNCRSGSH
jgi:hypothetical protein